MLIYYNMRYIKILYFKGMIPVFKHISVKTKQFQLQKGKKKKKIFIQMKYIWFYNV